MQIAAAPVLALAAAVAAVAVAVAATAAAAAMVAARATQLLSKFLPRRWGTVGSDSESEILFYAFALSVQHCGGGQRCEARERFAFRRSEMVPSINYPSCCKRPLLWHITYLCLTSWQLMKVTASDRILVW